MSVVNFRVPFLKNKMNEVPRVFLTNNMEVLKLFRDKRFPFCDLGLQAKF